MDLVLVRHGESDWNKKNLFTGWEDVPLTEKGQEEARECGRLLKGSYDFDICYTSYLKRAIRTLNHILEEMEREWLPVVKSWKLNERHYGALQGLNKAETAEKYGEDQVKIWRRSFDVPPPALEANDKRNPRTQEQYRMVDDPAILPLTESLAITIERVMPFYHETIAKDMRAGKRVLVVSHGNSLRSLVKYLDGISDKDIIDVNIPTGVPLVYHLDDNFKVISKEYLGNQEEIARRLGSAKSIGAAKK